MSDELSNISNKVINIFQRHRRGDSLHFEVEEGGELVISPDGFNYVTIKQDANEHHEAELRDIAGKKHYIVKMMECHRDNGHIRLNNYYVPGERLEAFMRTLDQRPGQILEIKQFIPDGIG